MFARVERTTVQNSEEHLSDTITEFNFFWFSSVTFVFPSFFKSFVEAKSIVFYPESYTGRLCFHKRKVLYVISCISVPYQ